MPSKSIDEGGVLLTERWKLFPVDDRNWELCELRLTTDTARAREAGTVGTLRWQRCGRFYSYGTIVQAILYVADESVKTMSEAHEMELREAASQWRAIVEKVSDTITNNLTNRKD